MKLVIEVKERDSKQIGRCYEEGWSRPVGFSGSRSTQLAAAKRALGAFFHLRQKGPAS